MGGLLEDGTSSCLVLNTTNKTWKEVSEMNDARCDASCVVFEGRIVVSGGFIGLNLNTVEAYDHIVDSWTKMPNMIVRRSSHKSVAFKNKLFIVGGLCESSIEVFDSNCYQFVLLICSYDLRYAEIADVTSFSNKIVMFGNRNGLVFHYDVEKEEWSKKHCKSNKHIKYFSCVKVQKM